MLLVDGKPHGFTRLPLDLPSRGLPMATPRRKPPGAKAKGPGAVLAIWDKGERRFYEAVRILRRRGHSVWRVSERTHQFDNCQITTKQLIALSRAQLGDVNGQGSQENQHQEKVQDQVRSQSAIAR